MEAGEKGIETNRYKGLGEMNPESVVGYHDESRDALDC